jgi:hypothetical protein
MKTANQFFRETLLTPGIRQHSQRNDWSRFAVDMALIVFLAAMLSGCVAVPIKRIRPVIGPPPDVCDKNRREYLPGEPGDAFHYILPNGHSARTFEEFHREVIASVKPKLPPALQQHKVTLAFIDLLTSASGEAQLETQIAENTISQADIALERNAIKKHSPPSRLTHSEMKDFVDKLFDLQLRPVPADLAMAPAHPPLDADFLSYFKTYYAGKFVDRMGNTIEKPQISTKIPDSEIVAAETVLLEFLIDAIDTTTPVMGDTDKPKDGTTHFYPGGKTAEPTALKIGLAQYLKLLDHAECGFTTNNVWVLKDLANGASDQAAGVGGLVANTFGGVSILAKISIGDNQTLSVMVKTAASRAALRATLASSYLILRHVHFDVQEP